MPFVFVDEKGIMVKIIIAGSRILSNYDLVAMECDRFIGEYFSDCDIEVVSGKCGQGADAIGEKYAENRSYKVKEFPADWNKYGHAAGPIRNAKMADYANAAIVFWDGKSRGSINMILVAQKKGLVVKVVRI